jgi:hypothetical protein
MNNAMTNAMVPHVKRRIGVLVRLCIVAFTVN